MINKLLLITFLTGYAYASSAQDLIIKNNGEDEQAKVKEVGPKTITYKRWDNLNGPDFIIPKAEVKSIVYENGKEDVFTNGGFTTRSSSRFAEVSEYGKNIVALAPIWITNTGVVGLGFSYERFIDKKNIFSVILPVAYSFNSTNAITITYYNSGENRNSTMLWMYPGAKFYVGSKNEGRVSYAVGLSAVIGSGKVKEDIYVYNSQTMTQEYTTIENKITLGGVMLNNSVNIQPSKNIYLGIEFGIGIPYAVNESMNYNQMLQNGYYTDTPYSTDMPLLKFNFKVGYRF